MNPAALKTNVGALKPGGLIIADSGEFTARNLAKAGYTENPLEDGSLAKWQLVAFNISQLTLDAVKPFGLGNKEALRSKNMWTLRSEEHTSELQSLMRISYSVFCLK